MLFLPDKKTIHMKTTHLTGLLLLLLGTAAPTQAHQENIYHEGWTDFTKNGKMDVYENPQAPIDARVSDLM